MNSHSLRNQIRSALRGVPVLAHRLWLNTPGLIATVPDLRRAWGHCLHVMDEYVYRAVFRTHDAGDSQAAPRFVLRPAPPDAVVNPAVDVLYFGSAVQYADILLQAWFESAKFGLRPAPRQPRIPFSIQHVFGVDRQGKRSHNAAEARPFLLSDLADPPFKGYEHAACQMVFPTSTCLRRPKSDYVQAKAATGLVRNSGAAAAGDDGRNTLYRELSIERVLVALISRLKSYHQEPHAVDWRALLSEVRLAGSDLPSNWRGEDFDLVKHISGPKQFRVAEGEKDTQVTYGIRGVLELPQGVGPFGDLLSAGTWLHIGKDYVEGLGQYHIIPHQGALAEQNQRRVFAGNRESMSADL